MSEIQLSRHPKAETKVTQLGRQVGREGSIRAPIHVQSGIIFSDS